MTNVTNKVIYILGINCAYHESSVALLRAEGDRLELIAFVEEERFNRIKHAKPAALDNSGELPVNALNWALAHAGIGMKDIAHIVVPEADDTVLLALGLLITEHFNRGGEPIDFSPERDQKDFPQAAAIVEEWWRRAVPETLPAPEQIRQLWEESRELYAQLLKLQQELEAASS